MESVPPYALTFDAVTGTWWEYASSVGCVCACSAEEVLPVLEEVDRRTTSERFWAVGWISYEGARGIDYTCSTKSLAGSDDSVPLVWFAFFCSRRPLSKLPWSELPFIQPRWIPEISAAEYEEIFEHVRAHIARGDTYQVNLTFRMHASAPSDPRALFAAMVHRQAGAYSTYIDAGRWVVCSASPELYLERKGSIVTSVPMKGTAQRGRFAADDRKQREALAASEKNRAENIMIVDMVRNDMARIAERGSVSVDALCDVEVYPRILQLTSRVTARSSASLVELLAATFPAASITGAPKQRTLKIISKLERSQRGIYTGAVGVVGPDRYLRLNVAIRTAVINRRSGTMKYGVGSGVVWDSQAAAEYEECLAKASAVSSPSYHHALFETMGWQPSGDVQRLELHLERISESARYFGYAFSVQEARAAIEKACLGLVAREHRVRLTLLRSGEMSCAAEPLVGLPELYRVALAKQPVSSTDVYLFHKTTHRVVYERAKAIRPHVDDVILWNERGELTESTIANLILEIDGVLVTPCVDSGLLAGRMREELLRAGALVERRLMIADLARATRLFLANSLRGVWSITLCRDSELDGDEFAPTGHA